MTFKKKKKKKTLKCGHLNKTPNHARCCLMRARYCERGGLRRWWGQAHEPIEETFILCCLDCKQGKLNLIVALVRIRTQLIWTCNHDTPIKKLEYIDIKNANNLSFTIFFYKQKEKEKRGWWEIKCEIKTLRWKY